MIDVDSISKSFGAITAAADVTMRCEDGVITGLLGPNGAGKTTLLRAIGGLLRPDTGAAHIDGSDAAADPFGARRKLAMLPDARGLYARLTAAEHISYFGRLHGLTADTIASRMHTLAEALNMGELLDRRVAGFSQGERMKVLLARALIHDPQNVVLDEPTNGLDVMSARAVRQLIGTLRDRGRCVVLSSHVMQEVAALCDYIYVIADGRIVAEGSRDELLRDTSAVDLEDAFVRLVTGAVEPAAPIERATAQDGAP